MSIETTLLNLIKKFKAGKLEEPKFLGQVKAKLDSMPNNLTKSVSKTNLKSADGVIDVITDFYGWDKGDFVNIVEHTNEGIKIRPLSSVFESNETDPAKLWPTDDDAIKAISVLNSWLYELINNGGDNANEEQETGRLWYFTYNFKQYIEKAAIIVKKLNLPSVFEAIKQYRAKITSLSDTEADNIYKEIAQVTNWDDLLIDVDFIEVEMKRSHNSGDDDE